nr:hypothetical protein HK105_005548 [Polyrhizophydium stewartii]
MPASDETKVKPSILSKLKLFGGRKSKRIEELIDAATSSTLPRVDWTKANEALDIAAAAGASQTFALHLLFWLVFRASDAMLARLYDRQTLDALLDIWASPNFVSTSRSLLAAIVDQMPEVQSPVLTQNFSTFRARASHLGLLSSYDPSTIMFDMPEAGMVSLGSLQQTMMRRTGRNAAPQQAVGIPGVPAVPGVLGLPEPTEVLAQQVMLMDYNTHAQIVLNSAAMLQEAINFADPNESLETNAIVQEFRTNCIALRKTTNNFLRQGVLSEEATQALIDSNEKLTLAFAAYDEALERQLLQTALARSVDPSQAVAAQPEPSTAPGAIPFAPASARPAAAQGSLEQQQMSVHAGASEEELIQLAIARSKFESQAAHPSSTDDEITQIVTNGGAGSSAVPAQTAPLIDPFSDQFAEMTAEQKAEKAAG